MTPHPQQEYIITEDQLSVLTDPHRGYSEYRSELKKIRSRPAPAAPDVDCDTCLFGEQCRVLPYIPPCYNHGPDSPARAAAQAREDEREKVLDEIDDYLRTQAYLLPKKYRTRYLEKVANGELNALDLVSAKVLSLRHTEAQQ